MVFRVQGFCPQKCTHQAKRPQGSAAKPFPSSGSPVRWNEGDPASGVFVGKCHPQLVVYQWAYSWNFTGVNVLRVRKNQDSHCGSQTWTSLVGLPMRPPQIHMRREAVSPSVLLNKFTKLRMFHWGKIANSWAESPALWPQIPCKFKTVWNLEDFPGSCHISGFALVSGFTSKNQKLKMSCARLKWSSQAVRHGTPVV